MVPLNVKPLSSKSAVSGESFLPGEKVHCYLYKDEQGEWQRTDIRESEMDAYQCPSEILGKWTREVKEHDDSNREMQQQMLQSSEELFFSLFDNPDSMSDDVDVMKHLLALLLERKRIVKAISKREGAFIRYVHTKTKREFDVPNRDFDPEALMAIQTQLEHLVI
jgi:hypothetical protein